MHDVALPSRFIVAPSSCASKPGTSSVGVKKAQKFKGFSRNPVIFKGISENSKLIKGVAQGHHVFGVARESLKFQGFTPTLKLQGAQ